MKCKLSEVMELIGGGTPKTSKPEYWNGDIPWLSVKDFNNGFRYVYETEKSITQLGLEKSSTKLLQRGDVIISARGTVGEIATVPFSMAFNQSCYGLRARTGIVTSDYLYYLIKYNVSVLKKNTHGSVFDTITRNTFENIEVELPSIEIQEKIASILSDYDEKIELNNAINNNLLVQVQLQFEQIYSKGVLSKISDLVSEIESGSRPKGGALTSGVPSIGAEKIERFGFYDYSSEKYISEEYFVKLKRGIVHSSDVLLYKDGAYTGKVSMALDDFPHAKCAVNEHVFILRTKEYKYQSYLYCCLAKKEIRDTVFALASSKAAQPGLNKNEILGIEINIPNKIELLDFEDFASPIMRLVAENAKQNRELSNLRDSLLPKLMSGELDVSNIDF